VNKTLICALICAPLLTGCVSTTDESAGSLDRTKAVAELTTEMDDLGYGTVEVQPGVDEFLNMAALILKRQRNVMGEYRKRTENYPDVISFLYAYKDATPEQLTVAIAEFDAGAKNEDEKIGHKIASYNKANENIYDENIQLTTDLAGEILKSTYILSQNSSVIAKVTALNAAKSFSSSLFSSTDNEDEKEVKEIKEDPKDLGYALLKAKDQLSLALEANDIIDLEQATIAAVQQLQEEQEAKG
jgi:hypothetical protein